MSSRYTAHELCGSASAIATANSGSHARFHGVTVASGEEGEDYHVAGGEELGIVGVTAGSRRRTRRSDPGQASRREATLHPEVSPWRAMPPPGRICRIHPNTTARGIGFRTRMSACVLAVTGSCGQPGLLGRGAAAVMWEPLLPGEVRHSRHRSSSSRSSSSCSSSSSSNSSSDSVIGQSGSSSSVPNTGL